MRCRKPRFVSLGEVYNSMTKHDSCKFKLSVGDVI